MALNLIKLCVGCDSIEDLREWVAERSLRAIAAGLEPHSVHTTRMVPKRVEELLEGGSLYWVIKGQVQARQKLLDIQTFTDGEGISRCHLVLGPEVIETTVQPKRPFQGWRYYPQETRRATLTVWARELQRCPRTFAASSPNLGCYDQRKR